MKIAVIGAGPAGLALALMAARKLPRAEISLFDARAADHDVSADPRTLALALGSVQLLQKLDGWPDDAAQPITSVHVSQAPPTLNIGGLAAEVTLDAATENVPMLGAVLSYGALVSRLQMAWQHRVGLEPRRLHSRFGQPVKQVRNLTGLAASGAGEGDGDGDGVEVDAGIAERFDLAVVAEGGVFSDQARKAITHDYQQQAWVGSVILSAPAAGLPGAGASAPAAVLASSGGLAGLAIERFTRHGPLALLPLRASPSAPALTPGQRRAAMVWCVPSDDDPVAELDELQRRTVLNTLLPALAGQVAAVSPLKCFALGLNAERTLVDGAIVRIGNAAQTLHPVAGQGLNLGLRDAVSLVHGLQHAPGTSGAGIADVLRRLEWARAPDRWGMIAATDFLARSFTWGWPGLPAARGLGLAALQRLGPVKSALARQMMFGRR